MLINMYMVGALGTNCYLVSDEKSGDAMIVDPGDYDQGIAQYITENGLHVKYIALTHGHFDHIGGISKFKSLYPEAIIAAGDREDEMLQKGPDPLQELVLSEGDKLTLGDLSLLVLETPGHTPGGLCFYITEVDKRYEGKGLSGTVFSGDTLFQESVGRTDLGGGDFKTLKSSIREKLFTLPDNTMVLPGHMGATTIANEKQYNPFVR